MVSLVSPSSKLLTLIMVGNSWNRNEKKQSVFCCCFFFLSVVGLYISLSLPTQISLPLGSEKLRWVRGCPTWRSFLEGIWQPELGEEDPCKTQQMVLNLRGMRMSKWGLDSALPAWKEILHMQEFGSRGWSPHYRVKICSKQRPHHVTRYIKDKGV